MQPFEIKADTTLNLLRTRFRGTVREAHMKGPVDRIDEEIKKLGPRFTLITDLTELEAMDLDCVPQLARFMEQCRAAGVARVIRVIPDPEKDIGFTLLSHTHYRGRVPIVTCSSRAEAEREFERLHKGDRHG